MKINTILGIAATIFATTLVTTTLTAQAYDVNAYNMGAKSDTDNMVPYTRETTFAPYYWNYATLDKKDTEVTHYRRMVPVVAGTTGGLGAATGVDPVAAGTGAGAPLILFKTSSMMVVLSLLIWFISVWDDPDKSSRMPSSKRPEFLSRFKGKTTPVGSRMLANSSAA